jgi:hypothetical protein
MFYSSAFKDDFVGQTYHSLIMTHEKEACGSGREKEACGSGRNINLDAELRF